MRRSRTGSMNAAVLPVGKDHRKITMQKTKIALHCLANKVQELGWQRSSKVYYTGALSHKRLHLNQGIIPQPTKAVITKTQVTQLLALKQNSAPLTLKAQSTQRAFYLDIIPGRLNPLLYSIEYITIKLALPTWKFKCFYPLICILPPSAFCTIKINKNPASRTEVSYKAHFTQTRLDGPYTAKDKLV